MSDSGSETRIASGSRNDAELHDEDQVHQHHRDAERGEDVAEHLAAGSRPGRPGSISIARREPHVARARRCTSCDTLPSDAPSMFAPTVITRCAVEVVDLRRPGARRDRRHLAERHDGRRRRPRRAPGSTSGMRARSAGVLARLRRQPHAHVARLAASDRPTCPRRRRRTPGAAPARSARRSRRACRRAPRLIVDAQLRLLPARREPDVHRARRAPHRCRRSCSARLVERRRVGPLQLELELLLIRRRGRRRRTVYAVAPPTARSSWRRRCAELLLARRRARAFGTEPHVDRCRRPPRPSPTRCRRSCTCTRTSGVRARSAARPARPERACTRGSSPAASRRRR